MICRLCECRLCERDFPRTMVKEVQFMGKPSFVCAICTVESGGGDKGVWYRVAVLYQAEREMEKVP